MTDSGVHNSDPSPGLGPGGTGGTRWIPEIVRHMSLTLCGLVRRMHQEGLPIPREVEELTAFLVHLARVRLDSSAPAGELGPAHDSRVPDRLLVRKSEAAERLGVSVRTIERLVATGRLRQVQVERLARFRVSDLEAYVESLADDAAQDPKYPHDHLR
jgi:excisionase family DNA binding protein